MGRILRFHMPGVPFHITARAQGREPFFQDLQSEVVRLITEQATVADVQLLTFAVMPNHLHLMFVQGVRPLSSFMQPLLRRIALLVMRRKSREGHIFERPFRESACLDAHYFRNSIAYVHLNGMRGGVSAGADDFQWSSHRLLCSVPQLPPNSADRLRLEIALRAFARAYDDTLAACLDNYRRFIAWRMAMDRFVHAGGSPRDSDAPEVPCCVGGDMHWQDQYSSAAFGRGAGKRYAAPKVDLRELALQAIAELAPLMDLQLLRSGDRGRDVVRVRRYLIVRALRAGHKRRVISRFLNISETTISEAARASR